MKGLAPKAPTLNTLVGRADSTRGLGLLEQKITVDQFSTYGVSTVGQIYCKSNKYNKLPWVKPDPRFVFDNKLITFRQRAGYIKGFVVLCVVKANGERSITWLNL